MSAPLYTYPEGDCTIEVHADRLVKVLPCGERIPHHTNHDDDGFTPSTSPPKIHKPNKKPK